MSELDEMCQGLLLGIQATQAKMEVEGVTPEGLQLIADARELLARAGYHVYPIQTVGSLQ